MTRFVFIIRTCSDSLRHNVVYADRSCTEKKRSKVWTHRDPRRETVYSFCRLWVWQCSEEGKKGKHKQTVAIRLSRYRARTVVSSPTDTRKDKTIVYPRVRSARQTNRQPPRAKVYPCSVDRVWTACEPSKCRQPASQPRERDKLAGSVIPPIPHIIASLQCHTHGRTTQVRFTAPGPLTAEPSSARSTEATADECHAESQPSTPVPKVAYETRPWLCHNTLAISRSR